MQSSRIAILVPDFPESVSDAMISVWHKKIGENVVRDEILVEVETDKVVLEVPSPAEGFLEDILKKEGETISAKQILGYISIKKDKDKENYKNKYDFSLKENEKDEKKNKIGPSIRRIIAKSNIDISKIEGSGNRGRITSEDINNHILEKEDSTNNLSKKKLKYEFNREENRVPMTRLRKRIAERLLEVKNNTAMLTTFNEVNMKNLINLKNNHSESFEKRYGIRLGFISFFIKAAIEGLKLFPEINASIDNEDIIYFKYFDISIAISTPRGLVTPFLKNVEKMSIIDIEKNVKELAKRGKEGKLKLEELNGGNFTITNGGIFGSMMSTPIINPPQCAILGMHTIQDRPVVINKNIVIAPMMYLALSYDHRLIDGKEAVGFLVTIKKIIEDPFSLLLCS